jgi:hypothetical protein
MGGDLNLKKVWHPASKHNLERVLQAEREYEEEQKRTEQLRREKQVQSDLGSISAVKSPNTNERLEWMYQGQSMPIHSSKGVSMSSENSRPKKDKDAMMMRCDSWSKRVEDPMYNKEL